MASGTNNATTMISLPIGYISLTGLASQKYGAASNKVPRRKQRGINCKLQSLRVEFPAACGVSLVDERIYPQEPQRNGADVPLCISGEVPTSSV
jgi:hypothetical protein